MTLNTYDKKKRHTFKWYIGLFSLILITPGITMIFSEESEEQSTEKRNLYQMPVFSNTKDYIKSAEAFFNDHFGLRSDLITSSNFIRIHLFRSTPKPEMIQFGQGGFLFYANKEDGIFKSFSHRNLISEQELERGFERQNMIKDSLNTLGIKYELTFWPNKHSIYPEYLPNCLSPQVIDTLSLMDQVITYFDANNFNITDVRPPLKKAKKQDQIYYKLDTHWNSLGAYLAYKSFCEQTYSNLSLTPFQLEDFTITKAPSFTGDLIDMMGVKKTFIFSDSIPEFAFIDTSRTYTRIYPAGLEENAIVTENKNAPKQETLLVFRDSYTTALVQFFSLHYKKVIYIWANPVKFELVHKYNPDVVISGSVERYLQYGL